MISKSVIDEILSISNSNIVEIIGEFIQLKKIGNNYKGLSPFSNEKNPSFIVSPIKKIWKDFSSGKGGNIITFLIEYKNFTYIESLFWLANKYNIIIQNNIYHKKIINNKTIDDIYSLQELAKNFFIQELHKTKEGQINGKLYLINKRGFNTKIINYFELGYSSNYYNKFTNYALNKGYNSIILNESGLSFIKDNNLFDRFRNRIIFPIKNIYGKVIGFGSRYTELYSNKYKYINSPESKIFCKSKNLYGIYQAKKYIIQKNFCYLVEGYIDVISLYQYGIKNVVASLGTSLTKEQIILIKKLTSNIIILYDGDKAGINATIKAINLILENEINFKIVLLHNNEDPDTFIKKNNIIYFKNFIKKNSKNFITFQIDLFSNIIKNNIFKKEKLIRHFIKSISKISNNIIRELYIQELSNKMHINISIIYNELYKITKKNKNYLINKNKNIINYNNKSIINPLLLAEETILNFIIFYGNKIIIKKKYNKFNYLFLCKTSIIDEIINEFKMNNLYFSLSFYQNIFNKICKEYKKNNFNYKKLFLNFFKLKNNKLLNNILLNNYHLAKWEIKKIHVSSKYNNLLEHLNEILLRHKSHYISYIINKLIEKVKINKQNINTNILNKVIKLTNLKIKINKNLNRYV